MNVSDEFLVYNRFLIPSERKWKQ